MRDDEHASQDETPGALLGQLAEDLSLLVRGDLEVAAARRGPEARRLALEVACTLVVAAALLMALGSLTWAAALGLTSLVSDWAAALVLAGAWSLVAALLLRIDHPRRLLSRLVHDTRGDALAHALAERGDAERAMKATAERFGEAVAKAATERELRAPIDRAEHLLQATEREADDLARALAAALLAPGRVGLGALEAVLGRRGRPRKSDLPPPPVPRRKTRS